MYDFINKTMYRVNVFKKLILYEPTVLNWLWTNYTTL